MLLNDFALLVLKGGEIALIDIDDAEKVASCEWRLSDRKKLHNTYVVRVGVGTVQLHRFIKNLVRNDSQVVDHIDGDTLNNRRANLRVCTQSENTKNFRTRSYRGSEFTGVSRKQSGSYQARIFCNGKGLYLGTFSKQEDAVKAYQAAAQKHFGKYASANNIL